MLQATPAYSDEQIDKFLAEARREVARWGTRGGPRHGRPPDTTPQAAAGASEASGKQRKRRQTDSAGASVVAEGTEAASTTPQQSQPGNTAVGGANAGGTGGHRPLSGLQQPQLMLLPLHMSLLQLPTPQYWLEPQRAI